MNKLRKIFLKAFKYSLEPIEYDFEKLTQEEKEIYENQETINVIHKELVISGL